MYGHPQNWKYWKGYHKGMMANHSTLIKHGKLIGWLQASAVWSLVLVLWWVLS